MILWTLFISILLPLLVRAGDLSESVCLHHDTDAPLLLISRLDGKVSAVRLEEEMHVAWELDLGHTLLSTSNTLLDEHTYLIPSLDGNLYTLSRHHTVEPYAQLEALLSRPYDKESSSRWVGGKVVTTWGLQPKDGKVEYVCNFDNCHRNSNKTVGSVPVLALTEERRTVRLLDMRLGVERWNWSISSLDMQYIGVKYGSSCLPPHLPLKLHFDVEMGVVSALFDSGHYTTLTLPGPLSQAWVLNDQHLQPVNMFYSDTTTDNKAVNIYLGLWEGSHYIQPFQPHEAVFRIGRINKEVFELGWVREGRAGRDTISWEHPTKSDSTALAVVEGDVASHKGLSGQIWKPVDHYIPSSEPARNTESEIWANRYEILATILLGIIIAYGVYRKVFKKRKPLLTNTSTETEDPVTPPASPLSTKGISFEFPPVPFESRFEMDFEVIRELGQGGFGKVIEAKHKISEHNYAIKIIKLPKKDELRRKVEREVAAMAKLEHPHILRYYTSWKETPTTEWTRSRKYTINSDSFDSGTSIGTPSHSRVGWSSNGNSSHCVSPHVDDTFSDIVFRQNSAFTDGGSSIIFADNSQRVSEKAIWVGEDSVPDSATGEEVTFSSNSSGSRDTGTSVPVTHESFLYIQMQLCSDQTLREWLVENRQRTGVMRIFSEIVDAVQYIHSHNHIHRDLKPSNILFTYDGRVKVADFGLATVMSDVVLLPTPAYAAPALGGYEGPSMTQNLGTKLYMSPELETDTHYDYKVDIFALGIILFELLVVFDTGMERVELIQDLRTHGKVPKLIDINYPKYKAILLQMINANPKDRPTAQDVKSYFSNTDCDQVEL